jgi:predicted hydrocarbon binding protein
MGKVKGAKITSKFAFIRDNYGEARIDEVVRSMSASDQIDLKLVLDTAWYPIELYDRLVVSICQRLAGGNQIVYQRMGYHSADLAFNTTYRTFRGKSPDDLFEKMLSMHAMRNDPAEMKIVSRETGSCTVRVVQPRSTRALCKLANAFYVRAVELCGQSNVRVKERNCSGLGDDYCQFEILWD